MAVLSTQPYLLDLSTADSEQVFNKLVSSKINFEILNPIELGGDWIDLEMQNTVGEVNQNIEQRKLLNSVLKSPKKKGFFSFLIDDRHEIDAAKLENISNYKVELLDKAFKLNHLNNLKSELLTIKQLNLKSSQEAWIYDKNNFQYSNIQDQFSNFVAELQSEFLTAHPEEKLDLVEPKLEVSFMQENAVVIVNQDHQDLFEKFAEETNISSVPSNLQLQSYSSYKKNFEAEIATLKANLNIDSSQDLSNLLEELKILHTSLELENSFQHFQSNIFSPVAKSSSKFIFINIPSRNSSVLIEILEKCRVSFQKVDWNEEIVDWKNTQGLSPFQKIAQSMGTVSKNETDPSVFISFFFILFFSIALNDALYGLIICLFTGYFLYFTKLKESFKSIFNLFFLTGIGSIGWGALSNSWAGNLFEKTPVNHFLESFQLISPLKPESESPVNQILIANGNISPIVALLSFAVFLGLLQITTGYILKIVNAFKAKDNVEAISEISWMLFVYSGLVWIGLNVLAPELGFLGGIGTATGLIGMFVFNHGHGFGGKVLSGSIKLYELIAFLADLLSYTRLIAIGLTGAIIADVVNLLANLVFQSSGAVLGVVLGGLVLIIGHVFNIVVGLFGAYINPLRLHYVEFLPKFFQGKARSFKPLQLELKYVLLK